MRGSRVAAPLLALLCACIARDEVARVRSPGGTIDAVLVETNGGATTSFGYDVYFSAVGQRLTPRVSVAALYGAARSEQAYGVNPVWQDAQHLTIEYFEARQDTLLRDSVRLAGQNVVSGCERGWWTARLHVAAWSIISGAHANNDARPVAPGLGLRPNKRMQPRARAFKGRIGLCAR